MGRFAPKYAAEQRETIVRLMVDEDRPGPEAVAACASGRIGDVEPFQIPLATAYGIAAQERKRRTQTDLDPEDLHGRVLATTAKAVTYLEAETRRAQRGETPDYERLRSIRELTRCLALAEQITRGGKRRQPHPRAPTDDTPEHRAASIGEQLLSAHAAPNSSH